MLIPFNRAIAIHVYTPVSGDGQAQHNNTVCLTFQKARIKDLPTIYFGMANNLQFLPYIKLIALLD